ncbi:D-2-hydroxyacid dehydrogenase [Paeniclostridium sordellii]|uniref:D-2-hydroxyacid dehydrogenase n=1 Tax=Paraclostridium sordellii TaxID=1505 RepID=UPI00210D7245|nr:D-2-hydroxyacid dehydrogenase [Paeniclostridium sordellii]MCQ4698411.1 D-2-hydroxyacid dehydrogenase [Paeniclostridium sordellii]MDU1455188.1 D-2-hydroxyacid dehydrogenase [Paeniclostridium sordellii]
MKILMFSAREHELPAISKWIEENENNIQVDTIKEGLSSLTVDKAKGYDGISIQQTNLINEPIVYEKLKEFGIKQIASRTAGVDMIDLDQAVKNDLIITNVPAYSPNSVAELAVTQTMNLLRNMHLIYRNVHAGDFRWSANLIAREVRSITVGIVGTGKIGSTAAKLFKGLGANVIAFDAYENESLKDILTYKDTLEDVLKESDVVSLHTPLTEETKHMINKDNLKLMKKNSYLVNAGRGGIINTDDLIEALEKGIIAGAALDTFETEGTFLNQIIPHHDLTDPQIKKLLNMENVLFTHHIGYFTTTAVDNIVSISLDCVKDVLNTGNSANNVLASMSIN